MDSPPRYDEPFEVNLEIQLSTGLAFQVDYEDIVGVRGEYLAREVARACPIADSSNPLIKIKCSPVLNRLFGVIKFNRQVEQR